MEFKKTICALATALSIGCAGKEEVKTEVVKFPTKVAEIDGYFAFNLKGDEILTITGPNNYGTLSCFYTPGNKELCLEAEHPMTPEQREKAKHIYQNGDKQ